MCVCVCVCVSNGRFSLTECPRHRHFQPLVQYVVRNPSPANYVQWLTDFMNTAYRQNPGLYMSNMDKTVQNLASEDSSNYVGTPLAWMARRVIRHIEKNRDVNSGNLRAVCSWPSVPKDWLLDDRRLPYGKRESLTSVLKPSELTAHEMVEAVSLVDSLENLVSLKCVESVVICDYCDWVIKEFQVYRRTNSRGSGRFKWDDQRRGNRKINSLQHPLESGCKWQDLGLFAWW